MFTVISLAQSSTYVHGYTRSNGTYVQGYYRTTPNSTRNDNYSTVGNVNPYTGAYGTKAGDNSYSTNSNRPLSTNTPVYKTPNYCSSLYNSRPNRTIHTKFRVVR